MKRSTRRYEMWKLPGEREKTAAESRERLTAVGLIQNPSISSFSRPPPEGGRRVASPRQVSLATRHSSQVRLQTSDFGHESCSNLSKVMLVVQCHLLEFVESSPFLVETLRGS